MTDLGAVLDGLLVPLQGGFIPQRALDVARELHAHDPSLQFSPRVDEKSRMVERYEVWHRDALGKPYMVGAWKTDELDRIVLDVRSQDRTSHAHVETTQLVERHNRAKDAEVRAELTDAVGEAYEHIESVKQQLEHGRSFFPMRGRLT